MSPYDEGRRGNEPPVYSTGHGFYDPYSEPEWKREKKMIRSAGNGIGLASVGYVFISFAASAVMYAAIVFLMRNTSMETEVAEWVMTLAIYIVSLLLPFMVYMLVIKMPLKVAVPFRKANLGMTVGGVFVALGLSVAASYATAFLQTGLEYFGVGITMPEYDIPQSFPALFLYIVSLTVAPAFIEEIIFRGIVMQSLRRFGDVFAIVASSLIFGIFHLNLIQMPFAFILGLGIGYFVMRTGSLWVGVIIHFINNSVAAVLTIVEPVCSEELYIAMNMVYNLFCAAAGVVALCVLLMKYRGMFRFAKSPLILSPGKRIQYFLTSPALIIAMIIAVVMTAQYVYLI